MPELTSGGICRYGNSVIAVLLACYFFFIPFFLVIYFLMDPALKGEGICKFALWMHRPLSTRYKKWARGRIASGKAGQLDVDRIAATEWPVFGSAFYLWATDSLQEEWDSGRYVSRAPPDVYAAGAIKAATDVLMDPNHAAWVREHWGQSYLERENVFYRMLLIGGLTSYCRLLGRREHLPFLRTQVDTLCAELDWSPYGLLDDYPDQCYPTDVLAAIAAIKRADEVLGTDCSEFADRAIRAFQGEMLDPIGLPPYAADSATGVIGPARGCSSQWAILWASGLWPEAAQSWYESFERHFWQKRWSAVGFREFAKGTRHSDWYIDVDSGPVIAGFGAAASAFGVGAARAAGRFDHAYPLSAEVIALCWPLPDGTLFVPRILSNASHAPYLGEAAIVFALTRPTPVQMKVRQGGSIPGIAYLALLCYLGIGLAAAVSAIRGFAGWRKNKPQLSVPWSTLQLVFWLVLLTGGSILLVLGNLPLGLLLVLLAQFLPRTRKASQRNGLA